MWRISSSPSISGMTQSVITTAKSPWPKRSQAAAPSPAVTTSCPHFSRKLFRRKRDTASSSAIRTFTVSPPGPQPGLRCRSDQFTLFRSGCGELFAAENVDLVGPARRAGPETGKVRLDEPDLPDSRHKRPQRKELFFLAPFFRLGGERQILDLGFLDELGEGDLPRARLVEQFFRGRDDQLGGQVGCTRTFGPLGGVAAFVNVFHI